jgi:hypothetical protein
MTDTDQQRIVAEGAQYGTRHWSENCPACAAPPGADNRWTCERRLITPGANVGTRACADRAMAQETARWWHHD